MMTLASASRKACPNRHAAELPWAGHRVGIRDWHPVSATGHLALILTSVADKIEPDTAELLDTVERFLFPPPKVTDSVATQSATQTQ